MLYRAALAIALLGAPQDALGESKEDERTAPSIEFAVWERGPARVWRLRVVNRGTEAIRLATDPRLLWFEVEVPGKKKRVTCRLPPELFPRKVDPEFTVVLEPEHAFALAFDPRLYCFDPGTQLVPGSILWPHFGWPDEKRTTWKRGRRVESEPGPPFVARAVDKSSSLAPSKNVQGEPRALRSSYSAWSGVRIREGAPRGQEPTLSMSKGSDAHAERTATVEVKLKNPSKKRHRVYFRRELLTFEVMGPDGLVTCRPSERDRHPDAQAFLSLWPGRTVTITSRLVELCHRGTFGRPGLYLINATFDATESGEDFGYDAFVGQLTTRAPIAVRIRTGTKPFAMKRPATPSEVSDPR